MWPKLYKENSTSLVLTLVAFLMNGSKDCYGSFPYIQTSQQTVEVNVAVAVPGSTQTGSRAKRSDDNFPNEIHIDLTAHNLRQKLLLQRNVELTDDVPLYVNRANSIQRHRIPSNKTVAFYDGQQHRAAFMVWRKEGQLEDPASFSFFGTFTANTHSYMMQPPQSGFWNHSLAEITEATPSQTNFQSIPGQMSSGLRPELKTDQAVNRRSVGLNDYIKHQRNKRQIKKYQVELFCVVDYADYTFWHDQTPAAASNRSDIALTNIKQFFAFVINAMNVRYQSVSSKDFAISLSYAGIFIAEKSDDIPFLKSNANISSGLGPNQLLASTTLKNFQDWGESYLAKTQNYDHAALFTGKDLGNITTGGKFDSSVTGFAFTSGLCSPNKYSIIEDRFQATVATVASHELGHNLGSRHDYDGNQCLSSDNYIMAVSSTVGENPATNVHQFFFSNCSLNYIDKYITQMNSNDSNCMTWSTSHNTSDYDHFAGDIAGQEYLPDAQCEKAFGSGFYLARMYFDGNYSGICSFLPCVDPSGKYTQFTLAWEGTSCGTGRLCQSGYCVSSAKAPTFANDNCLFGDVPSQLYTLNGTCEDILGSSNKSYICYQDVFRKLCCNTCEKHRIANEPFPGCTYGDRITSCVSTECSQYIDDIRLECCNTCHVTTTKPPTATATTTKTTSTSTTRATSTSNVPTTATTATTKSSTTTATSTTKTTTTTPTTTSTSTTTAKSTITNTGIKQTTAVLEFPLNTSGVNLDDGSVRTSIHDELEAFYKRLLTISFRALIILKLSRGSLIVDFQVKYDESILAATDFINANINLLSGTESVTLLTQTISASVVRIENVTVTKDTLQDQTVLCAILSLATGGCTKSFHCSLTNGRPSCISDTQPPNVDLILMLVLPWMFVILLVAFVYIVWSTCRFRRNKALSDVLFNVPLERRTLHNNKFNNNWRQRDLGTTDHWKSVLDVPDDNRRTKIGDTKLKTDI